MGKGFLSTRDGEQDAAGNIVIESGSDEAERLQDGGLNPEEYASRIVWDVISEGGNLDGTIETALSESKKPEEIAHQLIAYYRGFYNVALREAEEVKKQDGTGYEEVEEYLGQAGFKLTPLAGNVEQYLKTEDGVDVMVHASGSPPGAMIDPVTVEFGATDHDAVFKVSFPTLRAFLDSID